MDTNVSEIWKPHPLDEGQMLSWKIGDFVFKARRTAHEWQVARMDDGESQDAVKWQRFTVGDEAKVVEPAPMMPDLSVIVRPEAPVYLAPGHDAVFFVSIPLWFKLSAGQERKLVLCDQSVVKLSKTWFGDPTNGELCYALRTRARHQDDNTDSIEPHRAVCRIKMRNETDHPVEFQRLCIPVRKFSVYRSSLGLLGNDVTVAFKSESLHRVQIQGRPSEAASDAPLGVARETAPEGHYFQRSFGLLRNLMG